MSTVAAAVKLVISLVFGILTILLIFRILFKILGANFSAAFTQWVYGVTDPMASTFEGVFPPNEFFLDTAAILALVVYALGAFFLNMLVDRLDSMYTKSREKIKK